MPSVNWFFPPSDSDTVVVVEGLNNDSVPLLRTADHLYQDLCAGTLTVRIDTAVDLRASAVYINAMTDVCPDTLIDSNVVTVTLYFSDSTDSMTHTKDLFYGTDIRNYSTYSEINAARESCPAGGDAVSAPAPSGNTA
jgi:hypothetical protein